MSADPKETVRLGYDRVSYAYRADDVDYEASGYREFLSWLGAAARRGSRVLDLGCGNGVPVVQVLSRDHSVIGVDLSLVQVRRARDLAPRAALLQADMGALAFAPGCFDAVTAFYSIIHVPMAEQPDLFRRVFRWLKPGGHFLAILGRQAWTGTEPDWRGVAGATMYWSHGDVSAYRRWLGEAGFALLREGFVPEDDGGHTLFLARRPVTASESSAGQVSGRSNRRTAQQMNRGLEVMTENRREVATLAGGCFWCLEAVYKQLKGVESVVSGYAGGHVNRPSYEQVCSGRTGHAEVVQITYDPDEVSYRDLLNIFFTIHDPTTLNRQGNDVGTQYRSAIFYHDAQQEETARATVAELAERQLWPDPIVTELAPAGDFYAAEDYHQDYFEKNPYQPYCRAVVAPKVAKFRKLYFQRLKA
jgi:peptide-methionine (S)-S-oxide reductase